MTAPKAAVIGTGHSGTGYVAALLKRNRIKSGHENWWPHKGIQGLDVDVSWLALPEIEMGEWSGPVAHVTRHPYGCVRSLSLFFEPIQARAPFVRFAHLHQALPEDPVEAAVEWWVAWNDRCASVSNATVRLEDLQTKDACDELGKALGFAIKPRPAISRTTNKHPSQDVPDQEIKTLLDGRAERYRYTL